MPIVFDARAGGTARVQGKPVNETCAPDGCTLQDF